MEGSKDTSISLNKFISDTGYCSRREADKLINDGRVSINGQRSKTGNRVFKRDIVKIDGKIIKNKTKRIYIALHKPVGIVCTTDLREKMNIISFINHPQRLFPIGRLDKPSEGLIFLTNDGDIVNKILRAGNQHDKEYVVTVNKKIKGTFVQKMSQGVPILETVTLPCKVTQLDDFRFKIILTQGLNRQIRRMCEYLGYEVTKLIRTRIMNVHLGDLRVGKWRELTKKEMQQMQKLVANSSKTSFVPQENTEGKPSSPRKKKKRKRPDRNPVKGSMKAYKKNRSKKKY